MAGLGVQRLFLRSKSSERGHGAVDKAPDAFRTISEVADELDIPQHVLRFWESRFPQIKPMKRAGGRRYYRPEDVDLLRGLSTLRQFVNHYGAVRNLLGADCRVPLVPLWLAEAFPPRPR